MSPVFATLRLGLALPGGLDRLVHGVQTHGVPYTEGVKAVEVRWQFEHIFDSTWCVATSQTRLAAVSALEPRSPGGGAVC